MESAFVKKIALLNKFGTGYRKFYDPLFEYNNCKIFKPFVRLGVYNFDDENLCHKTNYVCCNIPNCNKEFDTVFEYESHYNSLHRFFCGQCSKQLPSAHLLDLHLSEKHDSFFAVQVDKKAMYACYLEECILKFHTPAKRRNHCILEHKFPHDFRFDGYNQKKKHHNNNNNNSSTTECKSTKSISILHVSKLMSNEQVHDEDIELEDKSILLTVQRKPIANFSFGQKKSKTFNDISFHDKSYATQLTKTTRNQKKIDKSALENEKMVVDLKKSLPQ